jgi:hypothetical protein
MPASTSAPKPKITVFTIKYPRLMLDIYVAEFFVYTVYLFPERSGSRRIAVAKCCYRIVQPHLHIDYHVRDHNAPSMMPGAARKHAVMPAFYLEMTMPFSLRILSMTVPIALMIFTLGLALQ